VLLELTVDPEDLGRVIGKRGATAQSLRTLLRALGTKNDARYNLKIIDNGEGGPTGDGSYQPRQRTDDSDDTTTSAQPAAAADADDSDNNEINDAPSSSSARLQRTREELQELDDLDV
jgi:uncharacterized protein